MTRKSNVRKITTLKRSVKAISPVIATLLMIAIAVVASLVAYAWVMGYIGGTTSTAGKAMQIQSFASQGGKLVVYVQNVGQGTLELKNGESVYVNDNLVTITDPTTATIQIPVGQTVGLLTSFDYTAGQKVHIKVTAVGGTFMEATGTGSSVANPSSSPSGNTVVVSSVAITSPGGSSGGTVSAGDSFIVTSQIHLTTGSTSVSALLNVPGGYTVTTNNPAVATVGTSDVAFAWTVNAPSSAAVSGPVSVSASAGGYTSGSGSFNIITVAAAALSGSFTSPATSTVNIGDIITVTMHVTNTGPVGSASATAVTPASLTLGGSGSASIASGPLPANAIIAGGSSQDFAWTYTAASAGTVTFSGSASGVDQYSGNNVPTGSVGPSSTVTVNSVVLPDVVVSSIGITAPAGSTGGTVATGEVFTVTVQIHLSAGSSTPVTATLTAPGYAITAPAAVTHPVGTSDVAFVWTVTAPLSALAPASISVSAPLSGYTTGTSQFSVTTVAAAHLTCSFTAPATSTVNVGDTITVTLHVVNDGAASATTVAPAALTLGGTGSATKATGPLPTSATIAGGSSQDFTWTYTAATAGTMTFSGSASGTAQYSGATVTGSAGPSNIVTVNSVALPDVVVTSFAITAPAGSAGGTVATTESFTITAMIHVSSGSVSVSATPTVPNGYTITTPATVSHTVGTSPDVAFTWTVTAPSSASSATAVTLIASATGYTSDTDNTFSVTTVAAAHLTGSFTAPATSTVDVGATITVTLHVVNSGTASATAVAPGTLTVSGSYGGVATYATGPSPTSATIAGAGGTQDFTYTYTAAAHAGTVTFSGSASGTDQYSGSVVATGTVGPSNTVTIRCFGIDTSNTNFANTGTTVSVTLSNCNPNDVIIVLCSANGNPASSVTDTFGTHLAWAQRVAIDQSSHQRISEWWAVFSAGGSITITGTFTADTTNGFSIVAFAVSGANTASPFDANAGLPRTTTSSSTSAPSYTLSTSNANDMIIGLEGSRAATTETAGTGYTRIAYATSANGNGAAEYKIVTSTQSGVTFDFGVSTASWAIIGDAVKRGW